MTGNSRIVVLVQGGTKNHYFCNPSHIPRSSTAALLTQFIGIPVVFIFPSRAGGSCQAFTQTLDSAQQGGQYSYCLLVIGLPVVTWAGEIDWSVGTPPPRLFSQLTLGFLRLYVKFSLGERVCGPSVRGLFQTQISVMFRELPESTGSECLGSMTPETQDIYLRMDHLRRRSGYRLGRIIARQQLLKKISGGKRGASIEVTVQALLVGNHLLLDLAEKPDVRYSLKLNPS